MATRAHRAVGLDADEAVGARGARLRARGQSRRGVRLVEVLAFRVQGVGFGGWGLGCRVKDLGARV